MFASRYFITAVLLVSGLSFSCGQSERVENGLVPEVGNLSEPASVPSPDTSIPEGWVIFPKPKENSREARCGNYSVKEWNVEAENGRVKISPYDWKRARDAQLEKLPANIREIILSSKDVRNVGNGTAGYHVEPVEKGWLVGTDAGEWGGKLSLVNEEGSEIKELINDNIRGIARIENEILVLSGLAHLSDDNGKIWKLDKDEKGGLKATLLKELGSQPQGFVVKNKDLLVALNNKFIRISLSGEIADLNKTSFTAFFPTSMAMDSSGVVYVGARHFVVRFVPDKETYKEEWLVSQNCQTFTVDENEMDCVCRK